MDQAQLQERLMAAFVAELDEHVRALNRDALALEQQPTGTSRDELLRRLFRTAHTVKSAARAVGASSIEATTHRLEDLLAATRDGAVEVDDALLSLLFDAADALEECRGRLGEGQPLDGASLTALLSRVEALARGEPLPVAPRRPRRTPPPDPVEPSVASRPPAEAAAPTSAPRPPSTARRCRACGNELTDGGACPVCERAGVRSTLDGGVVRLSPAKLDALLDRSGALLTAVYARSQPVLVLDEVCERMRTWARESLELERDLHELLGPSAPDLRARIHRVTTRWRDVGAELERLAVRVRIQQHELELLAEPLLDDVRRARMLPFAEACQGFDRLVRDLARQARKEVVLSIDGSAVELDRVVIEQLKDPLRHLVRNAIDHGLEEPAERRAAGKPEAGSVVIGATLHGARVAIVVRDDGRGIDRAAVASEATRRGLVPPADEAALAALLFQAGFSTARVVTDVSGRGVGLDIVRERVEAMHGTVTIESEAGRGSTFSLSVPLNLSGLRAMLVRVGRGLFAFPSAAVGGLIAVPRADLVTVEGREVVPWQGRHVPLVHLGSFLGQRADRVEAAPTVPAVNGVVGERAVACVVDELVAEQEITVRTLSPRLSHLPALAGATLLADGSVALILSATALLRAAMEPSRSTSLAAAPTAREPKRPHVLLVEDSLTTRSLEKMILEAAGYRVTPTVDGRDALDRLDTLDVDLVVTDVQMPRVDGFELTKALRGSTRFASLPIVLVTGMGSDADRKRGLEAGADAYLVKSAFDQAELLATLVQLLGRRPA